jgi:hypothetical protein
VLLLKQGTRSPSRGEREPEEIAPRVTERDEYSDDAEGGDGQETETAPRRDARARIPPSGVVKVRSRQK